MAKKSAGLQERKETIFQEIQRECEDSQKRGIGLSEALYHLGCAYENGEDRMQDILAAIYCMMRAAELGNCEAMKHLAKIYLAGIHIGSSYPASTSLSWHFLGMPFLILPELFKRDRNLCKAIMFYEMAADAGNVEAMKELVQMYEKANSPQKAAHWQEMLEEAERKYHE